MNETAMPQDRELTLEQLNYLDTQIATKQSFDFFDRRYTISSGSYSSFTPSGRTKHTFG